jgi:hypothetical protein
MQHTMKWPLYGSTIFAAKCLPGSYGNNSDLCIAVNQEGIYVLARRYSSSLSLSLSLSPSLFSLRSTIFAAKCLPGSYGNNSDLCIAVNQEGIYVLARRYSLLSLSLSLPSLSPLSLPLSLSLLSLFSLRLYRQMFAWFIWQ